MFGHIGKCCLLLVILQIGRILPSPVNTLVINDDRPSRSEQIISYMNTSVDPCDDFYEFACGNYGTYHSAEKEKENYIFMIKEMEIAYDKLIIDILLAEDETDSAIAKKVKMAYRSCLDFPAFLEHHPDTYLTLSAEIGQMPALVGEDWQENEFDWLRTVTGIKYKYGIAIISECVVLADFTNSSVNGLYIGEKGLEFERLVYVDDEFKPLIENYRRQVAVNLIKYFKMDTALAVKTANEIVDFESVIAQGLPDNRIVQSPDEVYIPKTIEFLDQKYLPQWNATEQILLTFGSIPPFELHINDDYQQAILQLIANTPKRIVANYIHYIFLTNFLIEFSENSSEAETRQGCLGSLKPHFVKNFDNMFYRKFNMLEVEQGVNAVFESLKAAFRETLETERLKWLSADTRKYALDKLNAMQLDIKSYESHDFHKEHDMLKVEKENYLNNLMAIQVLNGDKGRAVIYEPPQPVDSSYIISKSPAMELATNTILIPVFFLQSHYVYSKSFPNAYNYGTLGSTLGHELIHAFDDTGRDFDAHGSIQRWWDNESSAKFVQRTKCYTNQYKQYVFEGRPLIETEAQSENIADNGGVRLAYNAYMNWYDNVVDSKKLAEMESFPGLEYNHKQLFFISFSHFWCSDTHPEHVSERATDSHTIEKFRVIGSLSNFEEFATAFQCPLGSGMNPENKCVLF